MPAISPEFGISPSAESASAPATTSERQLLLWLVASVIVVSGCLILATLLYLRNQAIASAQQLTESFAQVIEEQTARTFQSVHQSLQLSNLALNQMKVTGSLNEDSARQLLNQELQALPFARVLWVTDAQGRLVFDTQLGHLGTDLSNTAYFQALQANPQGGFLISAPVKSRIDGQWLIPSAQALVGKDGSFAGTIAASVDPLYFDKLWRSVDLGNGGSIALFRRDGTLMMRSPFNEPSQGKSFDTTPLFKESLVASPNGHLRSVSAIDGVERLFSYRTLSSQPGLVVVVGQSTELVLAPWYQFAKLVTALWVMAATGISLLCLFLNRAWRQKAQMQFQANRAAQRLQLATDAAEVGIWDWDVSSADQWFASPTYFTMLGYASEEGLGNRTQWLDRLHPDDRNQVDARIQAILAGAELPYQYEARMLHANGSYRWVSVVGRVLARDSNGRASRMVGVRLDITERKQVEEQLHTSTEHLSTALEMLERTSEMAKVGGWEVDLLTLQNRWSTQACRMHDLPPQASPTLEQAYGFYAPETRAKMRSAVQAATDRGESWDLEVPKLTAKGRAIWVRAQGHAVRRDGQTVMLRGSFHDITEQKLAQIALLNSETRYRALFEYAPDGILIADIHSNYLDANTSICRMLGYTHSELVGLHATDIVIPEEQPHIGTALQEIRSQTGYHREWQFRRKDGSVFHADVIANEMPDGNLMAMIRDVTERNRAQKTLRESAAHTQTILDNMADGVVTFDDRGTIESFNQAASDIFGYTPAAIIGRNAATLIDDPDSHFEEDYLRHRFSSDGLGIASLTQEIQGRREDGSLFPMHLSISKVHRNGQAHLIAMVRDITQQRHDEEEIKRLAFFDSLTGLPNRRLLMDRLKQAMATSARTGRHGALMFLDLDHFKQLNDTQGHDVGDLLLQQTAARLTASVREGDSIARLGGDEFVVLLESLSPQQHEAATQAEAVASKLLEAFVAPYTLNGYSHEGTTSIGIVVFLGDLEPMDDLLKKADLAMYQGKSAGRNTARFYDPAMQAAVAEHDAQERDLRRGIAMREFVLHFQKQVNGSGNTIGAEALVRWNHPHKGLVTPAHFIAMAEQTGLILALGQDVLQAACAQLVAWATHPERRHWTMAVNVSAAQFAQSAFVANVAQALVESGANPSLLKLELTESILVHDVEGVVRKMSALKAMGIGFSLDDFGTGYSSLSYLKRLPLDQLKIDQSFVRDVLTDPSDAVIARTILALGHSLGLTVIAEGVETQGQHAFLAEAGCDTFQGYYFGYPGPADNLS